jgi:23S rRNA pseudouridine2605 synthase
VDGQVVTTQGTLVDPDTQTIEVDGKAIPKGAKRYYIALHKPVGYVSTVSDKHAPQKVTDLVQIPGARLVPAGRLDADSEGLILLSNDGDFVYKVTHPSQSLGKTYEATVEGKPDDSVIEKLSRGLLLPGEERKTAPAAARWLRRGPTPNTSVVELILHEGRNRQVRRMLERVGHPVIRLVRVQVGPISLGKLEPGAWRRLTPQEVKTILGGESATAGKTATSAASKSTGKRPTGKPSVRPPKEERYSTKNQRQEESGVNETGHRGSSRPGPRKDNGKPAQKRVQVHQDRLDGRVSARGQRHPAHRRRGEEPGAMS